MLENEGIIDKKLSQKLQGMMGFGNIAVHDYHAIDIEILKSILTNNLQDIEEFYTTILKKYQRVIHT